MGLSKLGRLVDCYAKRFQMQERMTEQIAEAIYKELGIKSEAFVTPSLNNARQLGLLKNAKEALLKAKSDAEMDLSIDLVSVSLYEAYTAILEILGEANQIDISKEIFARFCVGK